LRERRQAVALLQLWLEEWDNGELTTDGQLSSAEIVTRDFLRALFLQANKQEETK
jgi:hypothetical protein